MLKSLTAALIAASVLAAPLATTAEAAPAAKPATATTKVVKVKGHKRHLVRHHKRHKIVRHVRGHKKIVAIKKTRHGKIVTMHKNVAHKAHLAKAIKRAPKAAN